VPEDRLSLFSGPLAAVLLWRARGGASV